MPIERNSETPKGRRAHAPLQRVIEEDSVKFSRIRWMVLLGLCLFFGEMAAWPETRTGDWTISRSAVAGYVHFSLIEYRQDGHSEFGSDWPLSAFQGLDISKSGRHEVHFTVSRDAGKFDCEGFLDNGEGAGLFHFSPNPQYSQDMKALGFDGVGSADPRFWGPRLSLRR